MPNVKGNHHSAKSRKLISKGLRKYSLDENLFDIWTRESAYALGWLASDGSVHIGHRHRLEWQLKDREPLEILQRLFETDKPIEICNRRHGTFYRLRICSKKLVEKAVDLGIEPKKSKTIRMPKIPEKYLFHFLRGIFDGDGSICMRSGSKANRSNYIRLDANISSGSRIFLEQIKSVLRVGHIGKTTNCYRLNFVCNRAVGFLTHIYQDSDDLRLTRKRQKFQEFLATGQTYRTAA